jgi:hypothetical protein
MTFLLAAPSSAKRTLARRGSPPGRKSAGIYEDGGWSV